MLQSNLATRPFYNTRAVSFWLLVLAMIVMGATALNVTRLVEYSRSDTELATQADGDETLTRERRLEAAKWRASVNAKEVEAASLEARIANDLIDRRTFSWTELFNLFEATLPADVRITSVRPRIEQGAPIMLVISVLAQGGAPVEDVDRFMENLEATAAFDQVLSSDERINERNQLEAVLEASFIPGRLKKS